MKFDTPLIKATLIRRYKRFLADVTLENGIQVTAHVANPGSMIGLAEEGTQIWVEKNNNPKRKLKYSWKLAEVNGAKVCVDTSAANKIVKEALTKGELDLGYANYKPEVKYNESSRVDFLLTDSEKPDLYLEVKSATLSRHKGLVEFPDSVTARGTKHMSALGKMVRKGNCAVVLFLVCRDDISKFAVAGDIDHKYIQAFEEAQAHGVEVMCFDTILSSEGIEFGKRLPLAKPNVSDLSV